VAIETWTAMHDRAGHPETGIVVGLLDDGRRAIGTTSDAGTLAVLVSEDLAGRRAQIRPDGAVELV
jgi:acetyl-CoA C-acetyltransferase